MSEQWLSVSEVSLRIGWSDDVVRRLIKRGEIEAHVLPQREIRGRKKKCYLSTRIRESEVQRFLKRTSTRG